MKEYKVKVGIKTDGEPKLRREGDKIIVENMLIGHGFHWQRSIEAMLPGEVTVVGEKNLSDTAKVSSRIIDNKITLINILPLETYLECVVGSEMNPSSPIEFLKAHVIISRNWVLGKILSIHHSGREGFRNEEDILVGWDDTAAHHGFDVCSDDHCQRYQGIQEISEVALKAIHATENEIILDSDGKLVDTRFSKCCGGQTELFSTCWQSYEVKCLESFRDPWCDFSDVPLIARRRILSAVLKDYDMKTENYGFRWQQEIKKKDIKKNLKEIFGRDIGEIETVKILHRGPSGRIDSIEIKGSESSLILGKELWIRRLLSSSHLYSSAFEMEDKEDTIFLNGRGWGHGVGLCQIGAANMAINGHDYNSIIKFYYPGSILTSLNSRHLEL